MNTRLQELKNKVETMDGNLKEDFMWLLEQAEKAEWYETKLKEIMNWKQLAEAHPEADIIANRVIDLANKMVN